MLSMLTAGLFEGLQDECSRTGVKGALRFFTLIYSCSYSAVSDSSEDDSDGSDPDEPHIDNDPQTPPPVQEEHEAPVVETVSEEHQPVPEGDQPVPEDVRQDQEDED
jgi:hypothetical protein